MLGYLRPPSPSSLLLVQNSFLFLENKGDEGRVAVYIQLEKQTQLDSTRSFLTKTQPHSNSILKKPPRSGLVGEETGSSGLQLQPDWLGPRAGRQNGGLFN